MKKTIEVVRNNPENNNESVHNAVKKASENQLTKHQEFESKIKGKNGLL